MRKCGSTAKKAAKRRLENRTKQSRTNRATQAEKTGTVRPKQQSEEKNSYLAGNKDDPIRNSPIKKFAVLIDADNISPHRKIKDILDETANYGTPTIKRIYGDFTDPKFAA